MRWNCLVGVMVLAADARRGDPSTRKAPQMSSWFQCIWADGSRFDEALSLSWKGPTERLAEWDLSAWDATHGSQDKTIYSVTESSLGK
jgi:hypothetical protein